MQITLKHIQITKINFEANSYEKSITEELEVEMKYTTAFKTEKKDEFAVIFNLSLVDELSRMNLKIEAIAHFEASENIEEEDRQSPFFTISAPSIAYPYVRTFISNFTLNAGYESVILPTFNFVKGVEKKESVN